MKRMKVFMVTALLLCFAVMLAACDSQPAAQTTEPAKSTAAYRVTVADAVGEPYTSGVIVRFVQNGEQIAMQPVNENGVAEKELDAGEYTVELVFTGDESAYHYDKTDLTLSADKTELVITLNQNLSSEPVSLFAQDKECKAYPVEAGGTYVSLTVGQRNYFLFSPVIAGTYQITADQGVQVGYYGAPHFVQEQTAVEVVDNAFTISVSADMLGSTMVIGLDSEKAESCVLTVQRIGEPQRTLADEPWTVYEATVELAPYQLDAAATLVDFDLTADSYALVYSEADGFYHLDSADGPLVLVRLGEKSKYLDSFQTILEHTGVNKYFFDDSGEFVKKESYSECLLKYIACMDAEKGVYPLTEDLKYIIQQEGDDSGWWDEENSTYLFVDDAGNRLTGINPDIAWLFMCCYVAG